ncbi:MAG: methyltransferase domain-containing protein [Myxococcota bacterium]
MSHGDSDDGAKAQRRQRSRSQEALHASLDEASRRDPPTSPERREISPAALALAQIIAEERSEMARESGVPRSPGDAAVSSPQKSPSAEPNPLASSEQVLVRGTVRITDRPPPAAEPITKSPETAVREEEPQDNSSANPSVSGKMVELDAAEAESGVGSDASGGLGTFGHEELLEEVVPVDILDEQDLEPAKVELPPKPPKAAAATASAEQDPPVGAKRPRKRRIWFEEFFNDDYLRTVPPPASREVFRQCNFIEKALGLAKEATILDVGCGLGLHTVELGSRGYLTVGLDLSLAMLSRASDEAQDRGLQLNFLHADMREMSFGGAFDAVLCWGTTFGYFDDETNARVIENMYSALKPGGLILLDVVNRDHVIRSQPNLVWFEGDGCVCMEESTFNYITSRLQVKRTVIADDGRQHENAYQIRLYALHELGQLLHGKGFRVAEVSGREATPGVFFGADSPRMLIVAERRKEETRERLSSPAGALADVENSAGQREVPPSPPAGKSTSSPPPTPHGGDR